MRVTHNLLRRRYNCAAVDKSRRVSRESEVAHTHTATAESDARHCDWHPPVRGHQPWREALPPCAERERL
eukprot:1699304-Rhodomonas_salina.1